MDAFASFDLLAAGQPDLSSTNEVDGQLDLLFASQPSSPSAARIPGDMDDFMRQVANVDSADGYFGGYCVVA